MSTDQHPLDVVQAAYAAFGQGDLPAVLRLVADPVDWKFFGAAGLPYSGSFRTRDDVGKWFASIPEVEEILAFEPREFISADDHVTVLGWERTRVLSTGTVFESEWVHVFTVRSGRVVRFWGMYDTEASAKART